MKKLLTTITLSALVGTSASNLKPMFTNTITNHGFKSNQINQKDISIQNENDINPFVPKQLINGILNNVSITSVSTAPNGTIYAGTDGKSLWKSNDGINFNKIIEKIINSIAIAPNGTIYVGTNSHSLWKSNDGIKFEQVTGIPNDVSITSIAIAPNGTIYVGNYSGLWKSTDGNTFTSMTGTSGEIKSLTTDKNNNVYAGTDNKGLWIINPINLLLNVNKPNTFDKSWSLYNGIVYNSIQKIDIKDNLVASATLDNKSITIPTTDLDIPVGEHNLVLTLKDKSLASIFGGDSNTGQVAYKLWVKTSIDKKDIQYSTNIDDTDLTDLSLGFIADVKEGKTTYHNSPIIETKNKDGTGTHNASLNIDFKDILIDYPNSFYVQGNVDSSNNFTVTGTHKTFSKNLSIQTDGIYHLHLVDMVGNNYDSYLELGESNWKLKGTFNDDTLNRLKNKLNVTVNLTDPKQLAQATGWLTNYDKFSSNLFVKSLQENGKGFEQDIKKELENDFKWFLKPLTYEPNNEPKFDDGLDKNVLIKTISDKANEILTKSLDVLPKNLNVNTSNVVNKSTLEHYTNWITNYQDFIHKNKDKWINEIEKIASRGFATDEQENKIKAQVSQFLNNDNIKNYLKNVVWEDNKLLKSTSNDYQQYIELDKLKTDTINWVNQNLSAINKAYQNAIREAESGLNLHGYNIAEILNGKQKPQTKSEIDNFADGKSYHEWLQSQANIKFHCWQLKIGLPIGLISLVVAVVAGCFIYRRTNPKYNPFRWERKKEKQHSKLSKSINSNKNKKSKNKDK